MAIGEDNPPPSEGPELPSVGGLGGVASEPQSSGQTDSFGQRKSTIHSDSDSPAKGGTGAIVDPMLGKILGRDFELVEKIGQGGMGVVYRGRQVSLDRVVAVKILSKALYDNQEFIKRFEREAKAVARINHPNIVGVYAFGEADGMWYMVCEFIDGSSLSRLIAEKIMLDPKELAPLMIDCLAGLAHVGTSQIVHRDIKPDNILITKEGVAKIADFGLAKDVSGTKDHTDLTAAGLAMGTPAYMSPEQCMGRRLDGRSDIYALGVTAYYALAGEKPFVGHSSFEIMTKQREYNPPPPSQLNPRVPRECSDLVMRMLAKNPKDRFETAELCRQAWVDLLQRMRDGRASFRTGEIEQQPPQTSKSGRSLPPLPGGGALPPPPGAAAPAAPPLPPPSPTQLQNAAPLDLPPLTAPPGPAPAGDTGRMRRPSTDGPPPLPEASPPTPGTDSHSRPITERRLRAMADAVTCPKCGQLNRAEQPTCSRCGHALKELDPETAARQQEAEAQRLYDQKKYGEAAAIYARLADKEVDRRQRSILRSREREVRKLDLEQQVSEVMSRQKALVDRGDLKGAVELLEQATGRFSGEATASTSGVEMTVARELASLRARISARKRMRTIVIVVLILGGLGAGAWFGRGKIIEMMHAGQQPPAAPANGVLERHDAAGRGA
jgi:serine/threonine-protein kinase